MLAGNLIVYVALLVGDISGLAVAVAELAKWTAFIPASFLVVIVGILNALFSARCKARLVFTRWSNPLPGCRAFSELAKTDSRIDIDKLREKVGHFPKSPAKQNALWYSIYKSMENDEAIRSVHKSFLLTRDYAVLGAMFLPILGTLAFVQFHSFTMALIYVGSLVLQFALVIRAARVYGNGFVTSVLARKSAEP